MKGHYFSGWYGWFSFPTAKRSHAVYECDDEIEERALCNAGGAYQEWDDPGDKPRCPKCDKRLKAIEQEKP